MPRDSCWDRQLCMSGGSAQQWLGHAAGHGVVFWLSVVAGQITKVWLGVGDLVHCARASVGAWLGIVHDGSQECVAG